jgi:hypothetical protein
MPESMKAMPTPLPVSAGAPGVPACTCEAPTASRVTSIWAVTARSGET